MNVGRDECTQGRKMMSWIEILGYAASVLVAISLTMSSLARLRALNLAGCLAFTAYGFLVGAYPVMAVNAFIAVVNVVYLLRMQPGRSAAFELLPIPRPDNRYLQRFLEFNGEDIRKFFPGFQAELPADSLVVFILRDMMPVGLVVCRRRDEQTLDVLLDYVIPSDRDFQCARYFYKSWADVLQGEGVKRFVARGETAAHRRYLEKMGYEIVGQDGAEFQRAA
jgi:hypothetical protein